MKEPIRKRHPNITSRELALKHGVCMRTIRNIVAEKREDFLQRAADRRKLAFDMRHNQRKPYTEVATAMNITVNNARRLVFEAKKERQANAR
ncbi:MAG: replication protein RepB [Nevskiaceae bacterium]|nr:MAG: replication protein RepB [Nevskiaceae bacterium]